MRTSRVKKPPAPVKFPRGWDEARVRAVIAHYENQSDEEAAAEIEAALFTQDYTLMPVPNKLVPVVRKLLAQERTK